jgi:16S rRNA pseudouridine516 synthase
VQKRRLDQLLSRYGYCTRSEAKYWVRAGRITVNGQVAKEVDDKAFPHEVLIEGKPIEAPDGLVVLFHKPAGYVCTHNANEGATIYELLPKHWLQRNPPVTSVGRLDKDTTGVLLLTDIGELVQRWTSPRHKVSKMYEVTVDGVLKPELVTLFAAGTLQLEDEEKPCLPAKLEILTPTTARLELVEGKYHQVKRMFASQGCPVTKLHRSRFGDYTVAGLEPGKWRMIDPKGLVSS